MEWRSDTRGLSTLTEILLWGIVGLVALMVLLTLVGMAVSIIVSILSILVPILVLGAIIYFAIAYLSKDEQSGTRSGEYGLGTGTRDSVDTAAPAPQDPHDRLTEQYIRGEISEAEYERRIEQYLDSPGGTGTGTGTGSRSTASDVSEFDTDRSRNREYDR